ncbi:thiamine pyrophosphokinase [Corynebacterium ulcerans]|uniref:Thiamin pyrophosphokinase, catalytic domain-containing protein n=1 Tax=Corynebacterium ramonii TaxID=3026968 RepID=A0ABM5RS84_9CORY|nr:MULTISPECIES: putative cytokinetic ring protein SteA [Corynebacterium]AIU32623.1 Thiamin pyrophosphokinase, catalytic domain-containing protein [Corynebacterium ramonii FRC0011]AKA96590.1 Thiamin pyrophosphokinase, catalytic domain-containing protein [Corynebacterium ulcerans]ESU58155.1 thiamine pyrophosphokinase [Corynebacterium ulcerans NCTC 12077]KKO85180.1 thiamine pyrophosphokinase [Corynebacterium ulcerans]KKO86121.1 thiamine pyrophosphokinase [Corynebacterium ulcerans]
MQPMSLFSRSADLPGLHAVTRDCSSRGKGFRRLSKGDIAVIDAPDISRPLAQELIEAKPAAVVNTGQFSTGVIPNFGPQMLLDAGILLVEGVGVDIWTTLKDGKKARLTQEGQLFYGEKLIASGSVLDEARAEAQFVDAQQSLVERMEAYFGNTIQFIHAEAPLLIDGLGVPDTGANLRGKKVLVVSPGPQHRGQVKNLRNFIREYEPVLIGVDSAADTLVELGYKPDYIVGDPSGVGAEALRSGARVILPAEPDGHALGLERIQDLGIGAMTFPTSVDTATDLALLLADFHGADLIVNCGAHFDLESIFSERTYATPAALLTRVKIGARLVDSEAIEKLYTVRSGGSIAWLWAILGILVAIAVVVVIAGTAGDGSFTQNLIDTWNNIALAFQGLFK